MQTALTTSISKSVRPTLTEILLKVLLFTFTDMNMSTAFNFLLLTGGIWPMDSAKMLIVLSLQSHCHRSLGLCYEYRTVPTAKWPQPLNPKPTGLSHKQPIGSSMKADTHFTIPQRVEGWVTLVAGYIPKWLPVCSQSPITVLTGANTFLLSQTTKACCCI